MCGISGFVDFKSRTAYDADQVITQMTDKIAYRGPDDSGIFIDHFSNATVALGHRRLSILDLSPLGHQPYQFDDLTLVYNGEVYNFKEVREKLIAKGYHFQSNSDTEVIIKAYQAYGIKCIEQFIGMFAFALMDKSKQKIFLVRDRVGVKPLYYYTHNDLVIFGSELKLFTGHPKFNNTLNYNSIGLYLQYSYIPAPHTIYENTYKLLPGHILEIDIPTKETKTTPYWDVYDFYNKPKLEISYREAEEELEKILHSALQYRLVADVPVGVFLSGGYDSTLVASMLQKNQTQKLKTFTIGFDDKKFDEAPHARRVADYLGTDHTEYYCTHKEAFNIIPTLPDIYDEPFGDNSIIPTTLVSQVAARHVKVALSADGGDEIFGGYSKYRMALRLTQSMYSWMMTTMSKGMSIVNPKLIPGSSRAFNFQTRFEKMRLIWASQDALTAMKVISQFNTEQELALRLRHPFKLEHSAFDSDSEIADNNDLANKMLAMDFKTFLVDNNLTKVDRASMSVSFEGREPLLDHRIIEFAAQLPSAYKYKDKNTKIILKNIVHKYVPTEIMDRPKMGFVVPIMGWFRHELKSLVVDNINEDVLNKGGIFNAKDVIDMRDRYLNGQAVNIQKLWHILIFQMWHKRWVG
jgi:asparagine synthase (glutamine-hydrolysing)